MNTTKLLESGQVKGSGKRRRAKLIAADQWGSSAFYPREVLQRDAATAFPVGTRMFENHLTESETWERPVGDVSKLVGKLISAGEYEEDNPEGPGVYADVEFYDSYVDRINEIGDDVGLSVDGAADYVEGERDGRYGKIVTGIPYIKSVDVVVAAGAGGKLISILESAGPKAGIPINTEGDQSVTALTKEEFLDGLKAFGDTLTTAIKESLTPVETPEANAPVEVQPVAAEVTEVAAETPVAEAPVETEPEAETRDIDVAQLTTAIIDAGLPSAVIPQVVASVQKGATVEDAVKEQTVIREAFLQQTADSQVRIVESDRTTSNKPGASLREQILGAVKSN